MNRLLRTLKYTVAIGFTLAVGASRADTVLSITQTSYDANDRPVCSVIRMNLASTATDACALGTQSTFGPDRITRTAYDADGSVVEVRRAVGTAVEQIYATYTYTQNGQKASEADANGNVTRLAYDSFDRLQYLYYPSPSVTRTIQPCAATAESWCNGTQPYTVRVANDSTKPLLGTVSSTDYEQFSYDNNGNKTIWRRRNGQTHTYTYDALNRAYLDDLSTGTAADVYTAYDLLGRVCDKIFASDTTTSSDDCDVRYSSVTTAGVHNTYDKVGRLLTTKDANNRVLTYLYNEASQRLRMTFSQDSVAQAYSYNTTGMLTWSGVNGTAIGVTPGYDPRGRLTSLTRSNGAVSTLIPDDLDRISEVKHDLSGTANDIQWDFIFNPASQIISLTSSNTAYDANEKTSSADNRAYDGLNRDSSIVAVSGGYDANGNLTSEGTATGQRTFTYDMDNRLLSSVTVGDAAKTISLTYDPQGRLSSYTAGATVTQFLYDGVNLVAEFNGAATTPLRRYMHLLGADQPFVQFNGAGVAATDASYLVSNYQGSIIALTDSTGAASQIYRYGPWGEPYAGADQSDPTNAWNWSGSRFRYTGQTVLPEAGLYYYKARVYDPKYGRFLQTDPIGTKDDLDLYAYVGDDPVNKADSTGLAGCDSSLSTTQCSTLMTDQASAITAVQTAQTALTNLQSERAAVAAGTQTALSADAQATEAALVKVFDSSSASTVSTLQKNLSNVMTFLTDPGTAAGGKYDYRLADQADISGAGGKAFSGAWNPSKPNTIAIDFNHYNASNGAITLSHEPNHVFGLNGKEYYGSREAYPEAKKPGGTSRMLRNADSIACFANPSYWECQ